MLKVAVNCPGRFGNNLIQYFAVKVFCNIFNFNYVLHKTELKNPVIISEDNFFNIIKQRPTFSCDIFLTGFFQNISFLSQHRDFIKSLFTVNNSDILNYDHYTKKYIIKDLLINLNETPGENDLVLHVRLDDFIHQKHNSNILDVNYYIDSIVESNLIYKWNTIWVVVDKLINEFDRKYIDVLFKNLHAKGITNIKLHQKTFLEDWTFCINATNFISSNSTFAVTAILLSNMKYVILPTDSSWTNITPIEGIEFCKIVDIKRINNL